MPKVISTKYSIVEVSQDGLIKIPKDTSYGPDASRFHATYESMEEVDKAILDSGEYYTEYIVLTVKEIRHTYVGNIRKPNG